MKPRRPPTARELEQHGVWVLPAEGGTQRGGFALRHPTGVRGCVSLSALPVSKRSHTAVTVGLGQSSAESDAMSLGPAGQGRSLWAPTWQDHSWMG